MKSVFKFFFEFHPKPLSSHTAQGPCYLPGIPSGPSRPSSFLSRLPLLHSVSGQPSHHCGHLARLITSVLCTEPPELPTHSVGAKVLAWPAGPPQSEWSASLPVAPRLPAHGTLLLLLCKPQGLPCSWWELTRPVPTLGLCTGSFLCPQGLSPYFL